MATQDLRLLEPHELVELDREAEYPGLVQGPDLRWRCPAWVPVPCSHDHRPDDDPDPGDRCKDCRWRLTFYGDAPRWAPTAPPPDAEPGYVAPVVLELSPDAVAVVAALMAPDDGVADDGINHDGVVADHSVWAEIAAAFPRSDFWAYVERCKAAVAPGTDYNPQEHGGYDPEAGY